MTPAGKAELWRMMTLALAFASLAAIALPNRWAAPLAVVLTFFAGERYRWWVNRKWDAIGAERRKDDELRQHLAAWDRECAERGLPPWNPATGKRDGS